MKCKICGVELTQGNLCAECKTEVDLLSTSITDSKKKINLDFDEHHFYRRQNKAV